MGVPLKELPFGLPDGGGSPPPAAQQLPSLTDLYVKLRSQGLNDQQAALTLAKANRQTADLRSGFREAAAITSGRPFDAVADRAQLMGEADKPIADLEQRQKAGQVAADEVGRTQGVVNADVSMQQAAALRDPSHPVNVAARAAMGKMGLPAPSGLTVAAMPPQLWATLQPLVEQQMKHETLAAEAPTRAANVLKTKAEATNLAGPQAAKTIAETGKTQAETGKVLMETTGQVTPGWKVGGSQGVMQKDRDEFKAQSGAADKASQLIDEINALTGGKDWVLDPAKLAHLSTLSNQLLLSSKEAAGIKGLPSGDVQFLQGMTGSFSPLNVKNIVGLTHNSDRLKALKGIIQQNLEADAKSRGIVRDAPPVAAPAGQMIDVISPEGKRGTIPAANLPKALQRGFKRADASSPNA